MTVRNWRTRLVEKYQYITPDGLLYELHDPPLRAVMFYEGDGFAPLTFETTRGPFQHGENVVSFRLDPRKLDLVVRHKGCTREDYWSKRGTFTDFLRHSRTDANNPQFGILRRILANGHIRDLDVYLTRPPDFVYPRNWDFFSFQEQIQFTAYNPVAYDPMEYTQSVLDFTPATTIDYNLVFPTKFPIYFGVVTASLPITKTLAVSYLGNWEEYPTIVVQGPATSIELTHQITGAKIFLEGYSVGVTETVTFNLKYGYKTVVNNSGISLLGYITEDSNLTQFNFLPDPLVPGGINNIDCVIGGGTPNTSVLLIYKNRYISVD